MKKTLLFSLIAVVGFPAMAFGLDPATRQIGRSSAPRSVAVQPQEISEVPLNRISNLTHDLSRKENVRRRNVPTPGMPQIFGAVISSTTLSPGVYEIPSNESSDFVKQKMESSSLVVNAMDGGTKVGNRYYSIYSEELIPGWNMYSVDAWNMEESGWYKRWTKDAEADLAATDFAIDLSTNTLYGSLSDGGEGYELCIVKFPDYKTRDISRDVVGSLQQPLYAMAVGNDGFMYALQADGNFVVVDKATAAATTIGASGLNLSGKGSGVVDPTTGRFFCTATLSDGASGLYEINLSTGEASSIYTFPGNEQITGLYCNPSEAVASAPGIATELRAEFEGGSLSGIVSFKAPVTDANGMAAQGELAYTISVSGATLASGNTEYGATVNEQVTLNDEGEHEILVVLASEGGVSEPASLKVRVGTGLPKTPIITASWTGQKMLVSWDAVTESVDGGYIDASEVTYDVVRFPGNVLVGDKTKATSLEDIIESPAKFTIFSYEITATYAGKTSAPAQSEGVGVGAYGVPYSQDFGEEFYREGLLDTFTLVDANDDGQGWMYNSYTEVMRCRTMSNKEAADDWFILPAITFENGMVYELSALLKDGGETLQEQFEVKMGRSNKPEAMTTTLIPEQFVDSEDYKEYKAYINPDTSGDWYIGFHCTTPQAAYYLYLDNISVVAKADAGLPQAPTEFVVTADENGIHNVSVSLVAPRKNVSGADLVDIDRLEITRDGELVHTFESPIPGAAYNYEDVDVPAGDHTYKAVAYNRCGEGDAVSAQVFVGIHKPSHPGNPVAKETEKPGEVTISWLPATTDENGKPLSADKITYSVVSLNQDREIDVIYFEGLTETQVTFKALRDGEQAFINFAVFACTEGGYSKGAIAPQIVVGTPYSLPWRESFSNNGAPSQPFSTAVVNGSGYWMSISDTQFVDLSSHDNDSGFIGMGATAAGDQASLTTGKISLHDVVNPVLSFYVFNMAGDWGLDDNEIEVQIGADGQFVSMLKQFNYESGPADRWNLVAVPLNDYVGKDVQVRFIATCNHAAYTVIDEIEIKPYALLDLRAVNFEAPQRFVAGKPAVITAEVENNGMNTAKGGAVVLYANGYAYMRQELPDLDFGKAAFVDFNCTLNPSFGTKVDLQVKVDLNGDVVVENDRTASRTFDLEQTLLPVPSNLSASVVGSKLEMTWDAPDMQTAVPAKVTEDFENSAAWTSEVDGWSFYDLDGSGINGFDGVNFPGIPEGSAQSFWVMDDRLEDLNNTFAACSGHKYIANMNVVGAETDDWAVSPELCGAEQIISFKARSYNWMFPETFSVMISYSGNDPGDFQAIADFTQIPWEWNEYTVVLPEGTRYFAFNSYASGVMLFIDDVTFVPAGAPEDLTLLGYNFYCDGILENKQPVAERRYIADGYNPFGHTYAVTAVYDKGESGPSNALVPSAVESVSSHAISIKAVQGAILVSGADGENVQISGVDGTLFFNSMADSDNLLVDLQTGIYIVRAADKTAKVVVK